MTRFNLRTLGILLASTAAVSLGACSTMPGPYNGLGTDAMSMVMVHKNPLYGDPTASDYKLSVMLTNGCYKDAKQQLAPLGETVGTMGGTYAVTGGISGTGVAKVIPGGAAKVYGPYVAILNGTSGAVGALGVHSSAMVSAVGSCANGDLGDAKARAMAPGLHIYPAFVRSNNRSSETPSWVKPGSATYVPSSANTQESGQPAPVTPPPANR